MVPVAATLLALLMIGASATAMAQNPKPLPGTIPPHHEGMPDMICIMV